MKKTLTLLAGIFLLCSTSFAYTQKEVKVPSAKMNKEVPVIVITPENYNTARTYPVVYLLHGYSGNQADWTKEGVVGRLADLYDIMFVLPDGAFDSWYFDSKTTPEYQYDTFVSSELVKYIDSNYSTVNDRKGRAITGLSMGGHGGLYLGIRHQDVFGSMGSMSGGVDIRPFPKNWSLSKRLGTIEENPEAWEANTVMNLISLLKPGSMNIIIDCGTEDFFYEVNCTLHNKLLEAKIPHEFYTRPGGHNWPYWLNAIKYQVLFFNDCFDKAK